MFVFFPIFFSTLVIWLPCRILIIAMVRLVRRDLAVPNRDFGTLLTTRSTCGRPDGNMLYHLICLGKPSLDQLRRQFHEQVLKFTDRKGNKVYSKFECYFKSLLQVLFLKKDQDFDLKNHIRIFDLNKPDLALPKDSLNEDDLMKITGALNSRPYQARRSPWELLLTQNFKGTKGQDLTLITLRIHHGIADGLSCISLIHRLFGAPTPAPLAKFPQLKVTQRLFRAAYVTLRVPYELSRFLVNFNDEFNGWKLRAENYSDDHVSFFSQPVAWSTIKGIMNKYQVNSNAAVYSIIAGALVRMMREDGRVSMEEQVPRKLSVLTSYPIPKHPGGLCNHASYTGFQFQPNTDSGSTLAGKVGRQVKIASVLDPLANFMHVMSALEAYFPVCIANKFIMTPSTFNFTHYPGPLAVLHDPKFATLVEIIPAIDPLGTGSIAIAVSTAGNLRITLTTNKAVLPAEEGHSCRRFAGHVKDQVQAIF